MSPGLQRAIAVFPCGWGKPGRTYRRGLGACVLVCAFALVPRDGFAWPALTAADRPELTSPGDDDKRGDAPAAAEPSSVSSPDPSAGRIFGVLPHFGTMEVADRLRALRVSQKFRMAARNSFDSYHSFAGSVATMDHPHGSGVAGYGRQYGLSFADNTIGSFMKTAVLPSALDQDPRYFVLGKGSVLRRIAYAASRSVVTRSNGGAPRFNASEIGGNLIATGLSNAYHSPSDRTVSGTLTRWGARVMWDTLSNELKEFWPDLHRKLHHE